jgi:hypothetical protein
MIAELQPQVLDSPHQPIDTDEPVLRVARTLADLDGAARSRACIWPRPFPIGR